MKEDQLKDSTSEKEEGEKASKPKSIKRRKFIAGVTAASVGFSIVPSYVLGGPKYVAPSDKINVAYIGLGTQGLRELPDLLEIDDVRITAVCDPRKKPWDISIGVQMDY